MFSKGAGLLAIQKHCSLESCQGHAAILHCDGVHQVDFHLDTYKVCVCVCLCVWLQIWCARTGALLKSCRGHEAEITDFAVSYDNTLLASGALDHKIRVWSLQVRPPPLVYLHQKLSTYNIVMWTSTLASWMCTLAAFCSQLAAYSL